MTTVELTSRERLLRTFRGEPVDRVPISLYEFDGFYDSWIRDHREYVEVLDYAEGRTDKMYIWSAPQTTPVLSYGRLDPDAIATSRWDEGRSVLTKTVIRTPRGELTSRTRKDHGVETTWTTEHLCKDADDARRLLSLPYVPWQPRVESFFELDRTLGDAGIVMCDVSDALCAAVEPFGFTRFLMMFMDHRDLVYEMLDRFQQAIVDHLTHLLTNGAVSLYRIYGPEFATPPYLGPDDFDRLVTAYDRVLVDLIHQHGGIVRVHSHGRVGRALESFVRMGIDATDPLEPPPDGDVDLREARQIVGDDVTLIGNIEERLFEVGTPADVERAVRTAIEQTGGRGFILCPTAMPLTIPMPEHVQRNLIHYIDAGITYGRL